MPDLRYPIGPFEASNSPSTNMRSALLYQLSESARHLRIAVAGLSEDQINTPYRPGGWTVRQVVHHLADAQMNWYVRTKLAITEHSPIVKSYDEARWAELQDARTGPLEPSLILLDGISERWVCLYRSLTEEQWKRTIIHPDRGVFTLDTTLPMHVWHCRHHTAHITELRKQMGWNGNGL